MIPRALISARRVEEVLLRKIDIEDPKKPLTIQTPLTGKVSFHSVTFQYSDAPQAILENISFTAPAGKTTAVIGSTGSGKSTLINLIPRFYDVTSGDIKIDDVNIKDMKQDYLHLSLIHISEPTRPY